MQFVRGIADWDEVEDRDILAEFLKTRTGQKLIPALAASCPTLLPGGGVNEILIRSGEVRGAEIIIGMLTELSTKQTADVAETPSETHPALDDDKQWPDGEVLSINKKK